MRIRGKKISVPKPETIFISRGSLEDDIRITCEAVLDYTGFDSVCPEPTPDFIQYPGQPPKFTRDTPEYQARHAKYLERRFNWMVIKSISGTEGMEWEEVDLLVPDSWDKYQDELRASNLSIREINMIINGVLRANGASEEKAEEARQRFIQSQLPAQKA